MMKEKIGVSSLESKITKLLQIKGIKVTDPLYTAIFKMLADVGERKSYSGSKETERERLEKELDAGYYNLAIDRLNDLSLVSFLSGESRTVRYYFRELKIRIAKVFKREIEEVTRSSKILEQKADEITKIATEPIRWYCFIKTDDLIVNLFIGALQRAFWREQITPAGQLAIYILANKNPEAMFKIVSKLTDEEYKELRSGLEKNKANPEIEILDVFRSVTVDEIKRAESSGMSHYMYFQPKVEAALVRTPKSFYGDPLDINPLYVTPLDAVIAGLLIEEFRNPNILPWEIIAELSLLPNTFRKSLFYRGIRITAMDEIVKRWYYPRRWVKSVINKTKTLLMVDSSL
jgi:hypothetical protein